MSFSGSVVLGFLQKSISYRSESEVFCSKTTAFDTYLVIRLTVFGTLTQWCHCCSIELVRTYRLFGNERKFINGCCRTFSGHFLPTVLEWYDYTSLGIQFSS